MTVEMLAKWTNFDKMLSKKQISYGTVREAHDLVTEHIDTQPTTLKSFTLEMAGSFPITYNYLRSHVNFFLFRWMSDNGPLKGTPAPGSPKPFPPRPKIATPKAIKNHNSDDFFGNLNKINSERRGKTVGGVQAPTVRGEDEHVILTAGELVDMIVKRYKGPIGRLEFCSDYIHPPYNHWDNLCKSPSYIYVKVDKEGYDILKPQEDIAEIGFGGEEDGPSLDVVPEPPKKPEPGLGRMTFNTPTSRYGFTTTASSGVSWGYEKAYGEYEVKMDSPEPKKKENPSNKDVLSVSISGTQKALDEIEKKIVVTKNPNHASSLNTLRDSLVKKLNEYKQRYNSIVEQELKHLI